MANNRNTGRNNAAFVLIVSLLIIIFVIVSYFMLSKEFVKGGSSTGVYIPEKTSNVRNMLNTGNKEVFHIRDNVFTYDQAKCKCEAYNSRLATKNEITTAYNKGAEWCTYGWSEGQTAYYPTQQCTWDKLQEGPEKDRDKCGKPGINGGHFATPDIKFGVNCFGIKPKGKIIKPKKGFCKKDKKGKCNLPDNKGKKSRTDDINGFNNDKWSEYD